MKKKIIYCTSLILFVVLYSSLVFAENNSMMKNAADSVKNTVAGAENVIEDAARGVTNTSKDITGKIVKSNFKAGSNQVHEGCDDIFHPGKKVGRGVYCTPNVETAEDYSGISEINGIQYNTVLMVRVKPDAIRHCADSGDYWVVNGTTDEIRPYRILYKKN